MFKVLLITVGIVAVILIILFLIGMLLTKYVLKYWDLF